MSKVRLERPSHQMCKCDVSLRIALPVDAEVNDGEGTHFCGTSLPSKPRVRSLILFSRTPRLNVWLLAELSDAQVVGLHTNGVSCIKLDTILWKE